MRYLLVLGVFSATTLTYAKDVVCPAGKSNSQVAVEAGDTIGYQTQAGATYEKNTNCVTKFTLDNSCKKIKFSCDSFNLGKGDLMIVKIGKKSKKFKGKKFKKPIVSTKTTLITFKSNKKKEGPGALCSMECIKSAATAAPTPPPTTGVDDEVTTRVKGFIDAGTCNAVSFGDYSDTECGDSGTSYYKEFIYNNKRVQISNNIPDHAAETDMIAPNPNIRCPGWQFIELPIDPEKGTSFSDTTLGTIGLAVTGGAFFNDLSNPDGSLALTNEGPSLDTCLGHSAPTNMGGGGMGGGGMGPPPGGNGGPPPGGNGGPPPGRYKRQEDTPHAGQYHYHGNINCTNAGAATGANDPDMCKLIGYYRDGVPVYGFCKDSNGMVFTSCYKLNSGASTSTVVTASGTYNIGATTSDYTFTADSSCNLDEANGATHPTTGKYSYFMTTDYPWTPRKYGSSATASYCSAAAA